MPIPKYDEIMLPLFKVPSDGTSLLHRGWRELRSGEHPLSYVSPQIKTTGKAVYVAGTIPRCTRARAPSEARV